MSLYFIIKNKHFYHFMILKIKILLRYFKIVEAFMNTKIAYESDNLKMD